MQGKLQIIAGGQLGSEGKGAIAGYLARENDRGFSIRVAGPNAGHTVYGRCPDDGGCDEDAQHGHPWRLRQVPVAAVTNPSVKLGVAAGSEIDPEVLQLEISQLDQAGYECSDRLVVDPEATIIDPEHRDAETAAGLTARVGSTGKGIGGARAARIMRTARRAQDLLPDIGWKLDEVADLARHALRAGRTVQIEGTQGYELGLRAGVYPQCTSSDCRGIDFAAMAGISPWADYISETEVWVVFRPFPIRVAGNSGPLRGETSWADLGLDPEYTTVTRKLRRVGQWDPAAGFRAVVANGGPGPQVRVALTMGDHLDPAVAECTDPAKITEPLREWLRVVERDLQTPVELVGTGPTTVMDLRGTARIGWVSQG